MVTIRDIARKAEVGVGTVSRVINNEEYVSDAVRSKVLDVIEELGYRPNTIARSLKKGKSYVVGFVVADISNPFFAEIARGVTLAGRKSGYNVILVDTDNKFEVEVDSIEALRASLVDGFILSGVEDDQPYVAKLREEGIPLVVLDRYYQDLDVPTVLIANIKAGYDATKYLLQRGHRRIGLIMGPDKLKICYDRMTGYKNALSEYCIEPDDSLIVKGKFSVDSGYQAGKYFAELAEPPTAIFAMNDLMAIGCIRALEAKGLDVPRDISLIGFDDIMEGSLLNTPLTTMRQPTFEMGELAMNKLLELLKKGTLKKRVEVLEASLIEGRTVRHR